jgi:hypothetical protein
MFPLLVAEYPAILYHLPTGTAEPPPKASGGPCNWPPANASVSVSTDFLSPNSSVGQRIFFSLWWTEYNFPSITYCGISSAAHCNWSAGSAESPLVVPAGSSTVLADPSFTWKENYSTRSASSVACPILLLDTRAIHHFQETSYILASSVSLIKVLWDKFYVTSESRGPSVWALHNKEKNPPLSEYRRPCHSSLLDRLRLFVMLPPGQPGI